MRKQLVKVACMAFAVAFIAIGGTNVYATNNSTFNQTISAGVLATDILDASRVTVASPAITMSAKNFSFDCQSGGNASTGTFGTASQRIYVTNPGGANNGWTLTLAATGGASTLWSNAGATRTFDFNNSAGSGCTGGQMSVNPNAGTLTADCLTCTTTNVSKGSNSSFVQGTTDSITLLNAAAASDDAWRGYLTGATVSQIIPAEQPADTYTINMTLTSTAL